MTPMKRRRPKNPIYYRWHHDLQDIVFGLIIGVIYTVIILWAISHV